VWLVRAEVAPTCIREFGDGMDSDKIRDCVTGPIGAQVRRALYQDFPAHRKSRGCASDVTKHQMGVLMIPGRS
jgi:hypothetical protein